MAIIRFSFLIIFFAILTSCTSVLESTSETTIPKPWLYADVKRLDGIDSPSPESDILAGYSRFSGTDLQIRLDFLDLNQPGSSLINIYLNSKPEGISLENYPSSILWDWKIEIDADGLARLIDTNTGNVLASELKTDIKKQLDYIEIDIPLEFLDSKDNTIDIFISNEDEASGRIMDQLEPFSTAERSSPTPAPLLISFWDVFKSDTPAQALRTWNGAHTGPYGTRHGLFHLLSAVKEYSIPIVLLDLKVPGHILALDYLDSIDAIQKLESGGALILPEVVYGQKLAMDAVREINSNYSKKFDISNQSLIYGTYELADLPPDSMAFSATSSSQNIFDIGNGIKLIPLPSSYKDDSTPITEQIKTSGDSFPIELKQVLIEAALSPDNNDLVSIGESLQDSALGDPFISADFFSYIQNHPWIKPLSQNDLLNFPAQSSSVPLMPGCGNILCNPESPNIVPYTVFGDETPASLTYPILKNQVTSEISILPNNEISDSILLTYQQYFNPRLNNKSQRLLANYISQVGHLIQAANWLESPEKIQECFDLDWDGLPECILANENFFSSFEIEGGRLLYLFIKNECGVTAVVAPFSQYSVGLSDTTLWNNMRGYLSDPYEVSGFLADQPDRIGNYYVEISEGSLILSDPVKKIEKSFVLFENELSANVSYPNPEKLSIPVPDLLNAEVSPEGESIIIREDQENETQSNFDKLFAGRSCVKILIPGRDIQTISPEESLDLLKFPENPDTANKPGHFLPFPFNLFQFDIDGTQTVNFISGN